MELAAQKPSAAEADDQQSKKPRDLGVRGLGLRARADSDAIRTFENPQSVAEDKSANPVKAIWGSEDEALLAKKHATWQRLRADQMAEKERIAGPRDVAKLLIAMYAVHRAAKAFGISTLRLGGFVSVLCTMIALWVNRAPHKSIEDPEKSVYTSWPIFGEIGVVRDAIRIGGAKNQVRVGSAHGFKTWELVMFGGDRDVALMDPRDREYFLKTNWRNFAKNLKNGDGFQDMFAEAMGRGIFAVDDGETGEWQDHRKVMSHMFSANGLKTKMERSFSEHSRILVELIGKEVDAGRSFDAQDAMTNLTFETICDIAFGHTPGSLIAGFQKQKIEFLIRFDRIQQNSVLRFLIPKPITKLLHFFNLGFERQIREDGHHLRQYVKKIIDARRAKNDFEDDDVLALYVKTARSTGKRYLADDDYLVDVVLNLAIAGRDTTSCLLTNMIKLVDERIQAKMLEEFDRVVGRGNHVNWEHVRDLPYCGAVINEVLRMYPPVAGDTRFALNDDVLPSGYRVKAGQRVSILNSAIGRDPNLWENPDECIPERWLQEGKPTRRPDEYMFPVFWGGPRLCLGKDSSRLQALEVSYALFSNFNFTKLPASDKPVNGPVQFYEEGLPVKATRRAQQ